jgi:hypothetical protein
MPGSCRTGYSRFTTELILADSGACDVCPQK